jgi:hypothetical protein
MLCSDAYSPSTARDDRVPRVRGADRMEVGGRQGRDSLFRSPGARRDEDGIERRIAFEQLCAADRNSFVQSRAAGYSRWAALSESSDHEALCGRDDREYGRCGAIQHRHRACLAVRTHLVFVHGRATGRGSRKLDGIFADRGTSRCALSHCRCEQPARPACSGECARKLHGATDFDCESARGSRAPSASEATSWWRCQQAAEPTAVIRRAQRRAGTNRSGDESASEGHTETNAQTARALAQPAVCAWALQRRIAANPSKSAACAAASH